MYRCRIPAPSTPSTKANENSCPWSHCSCLMGKGLTDRRSTAKPASCSSYAQRAMVCGASSLWRRGRRDGEDGLRAVANQTSRARLGAGKEEIKTKTLTQTVMFKGASPREVDNLVSDS